MKRHLLFILLISCCIAARAQGIYAGPDTVACPGNITLNANASSGPAGGYTILYIPYNPYSYTTGTTVMLSDEQVSAAINIGFTFSFMGNNYTQFYICSNGWVGFTSQAPSFGVYAIPDPNMPLNCIMGAFHDLDPGAGGTVRYNLTGTAPNRKLVVTWNQVPLYSCNIPVTQQIVLYESTNVIENYYQSKPVCTTWQNGNSVQGIQNANATVAYTVPGRNATQWTANNEGWRFIPASSSLGPITWYNSSGSMVGTGSSLTTNFTASTYYIAQVYDSTSATVFDDTVYVSSGIPGLTISVTSPNCSGNNNGSASVSAPGGPYTYNWSTGGTASTITGLAAGSYTVMVSNSTGCSELAVANISSASQLSVYASHYNESCAGCNNGIAYSTPVGGTPPFSYMWQPGNYTSQDIYNVAPGTYTVCITDASNCTICDSTIVYSFGVGVEEQAGNISFSLQPNPVQDGKAVFTFGEMKTQDVTISIITSAGSEAAHYSLKASGNTKYELDTSGLAKGIYFVRVQGDGNASMRKLVVQ
jgi:hypothetical protein